MPAPPQEQIDKIDLEELCKPVKMILEAYELWLGDQYKLPKLAWAIYKSLEGENNQASIGSRTRAASQPSSLNEASKKHFKLTRPMY